MIEVERRIDVACAPDDVWRVMSDPVKVVTCLPGASLDGPVVDGAFAGRITVAFGALRVPFHGKALLKLDESDRTGNLTGQGRDNNGGTRFRAEARFVIKPSESGTTIDLTSQVDLAGKLAPLIAAGANVVVEAMLTDFSQQLAIACMPVAQPATAVDASAPEKQTAAPEVAAPVRLPAKLVLRGLLATVQATLASLVKRFRRQS